MSAATPLRKATLETCDTTTSMLLNESTSRKLACNGIHVAQSICIWDLSVDLSWQPSPDNPKYKIQAFF